MVCFLDTLVATVQLCEDVWSQGCWNEHLAALGEYHSPWLAHLCIPSIPTVRWAVLGLFVANQCGWPSQGHSGQDPSQCHLWSDSACLWRNSLGRCWCDQFHRSGWCQRYCQVPALCCSCWLVYRRPKKELWSALIAHLDELSFNPSGLAILKNFRYLLVIVFFCVSLNDQIIADTYHTFPPYKDSIHAFLDQAPWDVQAKGYVGEAVPTKWWKERGRLLWCWC